MRYLQAALITVGLLAPGLAQAQVAIDMSRVTCGQLLALPADDARLFGAWMGGYFSQKRGYGSVDLENHAKSVANITAWCGSNQNATVMSALERFTAPQR
jgi:hypothetical protein